jgi:conjugal transfer ATP-binding protein TraC
MTENLAQTLAPAALQVTPNYLQIGDKFVRTIFVGSYPRYLNASWLSPVINMERVFDVAIFVNPQPTASIIKKLRDQLTRIQAQIMEEEAAGKIRNPVLETAAAGEVFPNRALPNALRKQSQRFRRDGKTN